MLNTLGELPLNHFFRDTGAIPSARVLATLDRFVTNVLPFSTGEEARLRWTFVKPLVPSNHAISWSDGCSPYLRVRRKKSSTWSALFDEFGTVLSRARRK
jgi:hypothetical protein